MVTKPEQADFLATPARAPKPRSSGLTHVLDKGMPLEQLRSYMLSVAGFIDIWKFGWGTAYLDPEVTGKILELRSHDIRACTGGTLLEIAWQQQRSAEFFDWASAVGFTTLEVSNGATTMASGAKRSLIAEAARRGFEVLAEVGSKDPANYASPSQWIGEIEADLDAGAAFVVTEGRESGTVGIYERDGQVREDIVTSIEALPDREKIIYEAPLRSQQAWLMRHIGPNVSVGNIVLSEVMSVESLRLGLRADTIGIADSACPAARA
ncbi:MAG: phosphosulfolactate synthase [Acidimicrobiia bacterium]|nr:phosphosulfolactate synthase [Acidimicrobiia bacterium]